MLMLKTVHFYRKLSHQDKLVVLISEVQLRKIQENQKLWNIEMAKSRQVKSIVSFTDTHINKSFFNSHMN